MAFGLLLTFIILVATRSEAQPQLVCTMSGPYPPGTSFSFVRINQTYGMTVRGDAPNNAVVGQVRLRSTSSSTTTMGDPPQWGPDYSYSGSGYGQTLIHTFNVVNQAYGYFWWQGTVSGYGWPNGYAKSGIALWGWIETSP